MIIDEEVVVDEEIIEESEVSEEDAVEESEALDEEESSDEEEDDIVVTIGDADPEDSGEEEHQEAPGWVKKVRKVNREQERTIKKLQKRVEELTKPAEETVELGPKPTLESSGFDDKKFEKNLLDWHERSRKVEEQNKKQQEAIEAQNKAWQSKQERYASLKEEHKFKDFQDAEENVTDTFSQVQQGIIVHGAEDPALVIYALGKNPKKLEELSKITDPTEFAVKIGKLEGQLKVTNRKAPAPEKRVSSGKTGSGTTDKHLERLRANADKTGDYTELNRYKRQLRGAK